MADLREGARDAPGSKLFQFHAFLGKFGKIICWCLPEGWRPHMREILDPPLLASNQIMDPLLFTEKKDLKRGFSLKKFDPIVCCRLHCVKTWPKSHSTTVSIYFTIKVLFTLEHSFQYKYINSYFPSIYFSWNSSLDLKNKHRRGFEM